MRLSVAGLRRMVKRPLHVEFTRRAGPAAGTCASSTRRSGCGPRVPRRVETTVGAASPCPCWRSCTWATQNELDSDDATFWSNVLKRQSEALGIRLINLVEEFKRLSDEEVRTLYPHTDSGHFNVTGNEYVAKLIYRRFRTFPEISRILFTGDRHYRAAYPLRRYRGTLLPNFVILPRWIRLPWARIC